MILALSGFPLIIVSIIAFVLIIGLIILIHEGGHFFFAKRAGILCHEFSIGMGPVIYKKQFGETTFCIRAIPIGGFVSMAGEEVANELIKVGNEIGINTENDLITEIILDDKLDCKQRGEVVDLDLYGENKEDLFITLSFNNQNNYYKVKRDAVYIFEKGKKLQITPYDRCFESKSLLQRFLTIFAGPFMNMVLAMLIYLIVAFFTGVPNVDSTKIGGLTEGYNAIEVLEVDDEILSIDGMDVSTYTEFGEALDKVFASGDTIVTIEVLRDGKEYTYDVEATTYIASIGISNIQAPKNSTEVEGLVLGNLAIRYKDDKKKGEYPLASGDVLTKVRVDSIIDGNTHIGDVINLTSWGQLANILAEENLCNVYFEYYSNAKKDIVTIDEQVGKSIIIESYTNEVLNNQRIEKIQQRVGISASMHFDLFGCIGLAFENFWYDFTLIFRTLGLLIAPSDVRQVGVSDLSSFVGIYSIVEMYVGAGLLALLSLTAMLSVNIGVMNILPIPALDGGRIVFLGYELVTRKKPSKKVENTINNVFLILLMILFVFITFNDILRLFK